MTDLPRAVLVMDHAATNRLFHDRSLEALRAVADVRWCAPNDPNLADDALTDAEIVVTTWGSPPLDDALLRAAPRLRAVFHGAGSVRHLVTPACWERDLVIVSAAEANAVPVAEFTLASVLYAGKRVQGFAHDYTQSRGQGWDLRLDRLPPTNYGLVVGLVGLSKIGHRVAQLLRPFDIEVLVTDPYAASVDAEAVGARLVELDELLRHSDVVSLHAPLLPATQNMIGAGQLASMRDGATLINTARGGLVDTEALTAEAVSGRLNAILDVTEPEPLPADSALYGLPNVQLTPHIAGSIGAEVQRMGELVVDEIERFLTGRPLQYRVRREDMHRVA
ncbi:hydroxyacid dehydrogenase [Haloactinopolyspora sp.]|uniref:hydroxyacid dehydrogenase n=1 Tax=Haloactinopolyspora sp. TaxID=1966353 RepID=UPI00261E970F|nr:hydroxyacid dehydrogenase [Haloactinopolyspora sp.]